MFTFVVCFLWAVFGGTLSEYLPAEEYHLHNPYEVEYANGYDNYEPSDYHFQYAVSDPHTGDHKSQWEVKEKGVVRGMYSLLEPDGTTRVVEYVADDHGFRATVKKLGTPIEPLQHHGGEVLLSLPEAYNNGYNGAYSGHGENYGKASYAASVDLGNHHDTSVEINGFTGNVDDDSSYTNYDDEDVDGNNAAIYYQNDDAVSNLHNYYTAHPEIISVPYKLAYQYEKPYAYIGQSYDGY